MSFLKDWLLGVTAAALAVALAQALIPEGAVKKAGTLVGALALLLAVLEPLAKWEPGSLSLPEGSLPAVEDVRSGGEEVMKTLIAQKTGAYIVDKGSALGCPCTVRVSVAQDENGWSVPWSVELSGRWTPQAKRELSQAISEELGIPAQRQSFQEETP